CYLAAGNLAAARMELERVVQAVPENLLGQRLLGDTHLAQKNAPAALHCYKMALLLAPGDVALAEKVHGLESGTTVVTSPASLQAVPELPESQEELEQEIPPLWGTSQEPLEAVPDFLPEGSEWEPLAPAEPAGGLQPLILDDSGDDDGFKVEHVSAIFEPESDSKQEITTETLGDLYFSQGQFDKALRIFEKLKPRPALSAKIRACRARLGVDMASLIRGRKIALLQAIVQRTRDTA
ncbi:tetratricopeptide repeat protein, partial [bacterium]|nr:tetratricopeptide repeat protein [bacterium]